MLMIKVFPLCAIWQKISVHYKLSGKAELSMASCISISLLVTRRSGNPGNTLNGLMWYVPHCCLRHKVYIICMWFARLCLLKLENVASHYSLFYTATRATRTATRALIKVRETDKINWRSYKQKIIQNWYYFTGKRVLCVKDFNWKSQKVHLKTSTEVRRYWFSTQSWGQGFYLRVNCGEPKGRWIRYFLFATLSYC